MKTLEPRYTLESMTAFNKAIKEGRLSQDINKDNYAGSFMYMGRYEGRDQFKNILTRRYIT